MTKKTDLITREILNTREAAALLKVTTQTIKNYIYSGKLKAIKTPGGHHRVRRVDLEGIGFISEEDKNQAPLTSADMLSSYETIVKTLVSTIEAFTKALDMRDVIFTGHSARVDNISIQEKKFLGVEEVSLENAKKIYRKMDIGPGEEICIGWSYVPLDFLLDKKSTWLWNKKAILQRKWIGGSEIQESPEEDEVWFIVYGDTESALNLIQYAIKEELRNPKITEIEVFCQAKLVSYLQKIGFRYRENEPIGVALMAKKLNI